MSVTVTVYKGSVTAHHTWSTNSPPLPTIHTPLPATLQIIAADNKASQSPPFSIKVGSTELTPYLFWGGILLAVFGTLKAYISGVLFRRQQQGASGKWVYDRSLGGKKV